MSEELTFSTEGELNRYLFFSDLNDINIFVEDKDKEYEYETIFTRLFKGAYSIASIIACNGKAGVKSAFLEFGEKDKNNTNKKNFYIVDGDFDRYIHQNEMINNKQFIYLKYYNIENYFFDEGAVLKYAKGQMHMFDNEVRIRVNYEEWKRKIVSQAGRLFLLYCAVQKKVPQEPNVSRSEYLFLDDKTGFEKNGSYDLYYKTIISKVPDIDIEINNIRMEYERQNGSDYFGLICGKFLLTSLWIYLKRMGKDSFTTKELRWSLLCDFDVSKLKYIKDAIDDVCMS